MHLLMARYATIWLFWLMGAGLSFAQNPYYDHGTFPATGTLGTSAGMRAELDSIEAGFAKLPTLSGNADKTVRVNAAGTALVASDSPVMSGAAFPSSPSVNALFLVTDDSAAGACDSDAGTEVTLCRWDGSSWIPIVGSSTAQGLTAVLAVDRIDGDAINLASALRIGSAAANAYMITYYDSTDGLIHTCLVGGVLDDCNKRVKLVTGKKFFIANNAGTEIFTVSESGEITNANLNTESSGNTLTIKNHMWRPFGACQNGTAFSIWDYGTSNTPTPACKGTTTTKGVLQFPDGATDLSTTIVEFLDNDWTGNIEGYVVWESGSTSTNNVLWGIAIACAGAGESSDPAFTDDDFTADANNGTANTYNVTAVNTVTTTGTCTAGKLMHIRVKRRLSQAGDTLAATAEGVGLYLVTRQAQ